VAAPRAAAHVAGSAATIRVGATVSTTATTLAATGRTSVVPLVGVMVALAAIDLVGTGLARAWSVHHSWPPLVGGVVAFGVLFIVYANGLRYAELTIVTVCWVVLLQIGVVVIDLRHGVTLPPPKLVAIAAIVALQTYLIAG
jgi:hypothetical protein